MQKSKWQAEPPIDVPADGKPMFQGDTYLRSVPRLPAGARLVKRGGEHVIAHSETEHHHVALGGDYYTTDDPMLAYLVVAEPTVTEHRREHDAHRALRLLADGGEVVWEIGRQREQTPEGWARVVD